MKFWLCYVLTAKVELLNSNLENLHKIMLEYPHENGL